MSVLRIRRLLTQSGCLLALAPALPTTCDTGTGGTGGTGGAQPTAVCGDGVRQPNEYCDGQDLSSLGDPTCAGYDAARFTGGTLRCGADCNFDTSQCLTATCGDGVRQVSEACDGADIGIWEPGREDEREAWSTCTAYSSVYAAGKVRCTSDCQHDFSQCVPVICGDGVVQGDEHCEGANLNGRTCASWMPNHYRGGTLKCRADCLYDESECVSFCGDGIKNANEECDAQDLGSQRCEDLPLAVDRKYTGGTLRCNSDCTFDRSQCIKPPGCIIMTMDRWYQWHCLF